MNTQSVVYLGNVPGGTGSWEVIRLVWISHGTIGLEAIIKDLHMF